MLKYHENIIFTEGRKAIIILAFIYSTDDSDSGQVVIVKDIKRKHCVNFSIIFLKALQPDQKYTW